MFIIQNRLKSQKLILIQTLTWTILFLNKNLTSANFVTVSNVLTICCYYQFIVNAIKFYKICFCDLVLELYQFMKILALKDTLKDSNNF